LVSSSTSSDRLLVVMISRWSGWRVHSDFVAALGAGRTARVNMKWPFPASRLAFRGATTSGIVDRTTHSTSFGRAPLRPGDLGQAPSRSPTGRNWPTVWVGPERRAVKSSYRCDSALGLRPCLAEYWLEIADELNCGEVVTAKDYARIMTRLSTGGDRLELRSLPQPSPLIHLGIPQN
jgi:hypothetical protein